MTVESTRIVVVVVIGIGATALLDLWALLLRLALKVALPNYCLVGRWLLTMPEGIFRHRNIVVSPQKRHECALGWIAHYLIGVAFAAGFVALASSEWLRQPTVLPALAFGIVTVAVPLLVMQPAFGFGIAASKTPNPTQARLRSVMAHTVFGIGLYVSAHVLSFFVS